MWYGQLRSGALTRSLTTSTVRGIIYASCDGEGSCLQSSEALTVAPLNRPMRLSRID